MKIKANCRIIGAISILMIVSGVLAMSGDPGRISVLFKIGVFLLTAGIFGSLTALTVSFVKEDKKFGGKEEGKK